MLTRVKAFHCFVGRPVVYKHLSGLVCLMCVVTVNYFHKIRNKEGSLIKLCY